MVAMKKEEVIGFNERIDWDEAIAKVETDGVNNTSIKLLDNDYKYIYTYIKKNEPVQALKIFERFPKLEVEDILYDLRGMYLVYFVREVK